MKRENLLLKSKLITITCYFSGYAEAAYLHRLFGRTKGKFIYGVDARQEMKIRNCKDNEPTDQSADGSSFLICIQTINQPNQPD